MVLPAPGMGWDGCHHFTLDSGVRRYINKLTLMVGVYCRSAAPNCIKPLSELQLIAYDYRKSQKNICVS